MTHNKKSDKINNKNTDKVHNLDIEYFKNLISNENYDKIYDLYNTIKPNTEFEFIFSSKSIGQENYIKLLKYLKFKKNNKNLSSNGPQDTLEVIYEHDNQDKFINYRLSIEGQNNINSNIKKLDLWKNHVIFSTLVKLFKEKKLNNVSLMKKSRNKNIDNISDNTINITELNIKARAALEEDMTKEDYDVLDLDYTKINSITFRLKQRYTLFLLKTDLEFVKIDITSTKTTKNYTKLNESLTSYELEVEYGLLKNKPTPESFNLIIKEIILLCKILQQSNYIITNSKTEEVLKYYKSIAGIDKKIVKIKARQPFPLEIQHVTEILADRYAVTDKADGERCFLIIMEDHVYFISSNLHVKDSGIILKDKTFDKTILDGEYIFIPKQNRHLYMAFDCLYKAGTPIRDENNFMTRLNEVRDIVNKCFVFDKQTKFIFKEYVAKNNLLLNDIIDHHSNQISSYMKAINNDLTIDKQYPLIRAKYFINAKGAWKWEIFRYSELIWDKYTQDNTISCPYLLDGLIYHPLEQAYITEVERSKLSEYKWKPPHKNSIDFYILFEKDPETDKILSIYDNSNDELIRNKPYRICKLYVGNTIKNVEQPVLFGEQQELYWAYLYLDNGEVRDVDGNILTDNTVVEFYYNNVTSIDEKFRWIPIRTRYDKTEMVIKYGKNYGNFIHVAEKTWKSIVNPILITDFIDLGKGNNLDKNDYSYDNKLTMLRKRIGHDIIVSTSKENAYYQKSDKYAESMRNFHNFMKSNIIYTYTHFMYNNNKSVSVLDLACGRGGDIMKFYYTKIAFYVGVDVSYEGLMSAVDGAVSRYNKEKKKYPNFPKYYFIHGDASVPLDYDNQNRILGGMSNENKFLINKFFNSEPNKRTVFDRINCQFALHYFLKNETTWENFKNNLNNYLKPGGFFMVTHFDAHKVIEALNNTDSYTVEITDETGKKNKLFEIIKKFTLDENKDKKKSNIIKLGYAIDVYTAWMFLEGNYVTEYLVDNDFVKAELLKDCDLELVDTDLFENQYNLYSDYFTEYYKYESDPRTRKFLGKVTQFYEKNEINDGLSKFSFLTRYSVYRKKSDNKIQKGGELNLDDKNIFYIDDNNDQEYSCMKSIVKILKSHNIIPKTIDFTEFYKTLEIDLINDDDLDADNLKNITNKIKIQNDIEIEESKIKTQDILDGINIFVIEKNCNNEYDVNLINNNKIKDTLVLFKNEGIYKPVYKYIETGKKRGIYQMSEQFIKDLLEINNN